MAVRTCKVSCRDPQGVEHTVEVSRPERLRSRRPGSLPVFYKYERCHLAVAASVLTPTRLPYFPRY
jgi:hypothetical protein